MCVVRGKKPWKDKGDGYLFHQVCLFDVHGEGGKSRLPVHMGISIINGNIGFCPLLSIIFDTKCRPRNIILDKQEA